MAGTDETGYRHPLYAKSLSEFGAPTRLRSSGGWILVRPIPGSAREDAMGCYPLFACRDWGALPQDLDQLAGRLVSLALVADPFGEPSADRLRAAGFDRVVPYKDHYVARLSADGPPDVSAHHRYYARRALRHMEVVESVEPAAHLDEWLALYAELRARHGVRDLRAFSRQAFERQLRVPGLVMFRAVSAGETLGAHLWFVDGDVAYSHLQATSAAGYRRRAAYALYWHGLTELGTRASRADLGGSAGDAEDDGLAAFKRGWAGDRRTAHFCSSVLDPDAYEALTRGSAPGASGYFPAYRTGEFT